MVRQRVIWSAEGQMHFVVWRGLTECLVSGRESREGWGSTRAGFGRLLSEGP